MPVQEVIIKFKADTSEIEGSIKEIETDLRKVDGKKIEPISKESVANIDKAAKGVVDLGKAADSTTAKSKSLKSQLGEMKAELLKLELAGKTNTKQFKELSKSAAEITDKISGVNQRVNALASSTPKLDALISSATGIAGAFSFAQGAAALFGTENEEMQKALLKVQASMAILNGLQAVAATLNKDSAASVFLNANANTVLGKSVNGTIGAFKKLFVVLLSNPLIAVAAGFAAVVGAIALFSDASAQAAAQQEVLRNAIASVEEASKFAEEQFNKTTDAINKNFDLAIRKAKAEGKSTVDLEQQKIDAQRNRINEQIKRGDAFRQREEKEVRELEEILTAVRKAGSNSNAAVEDIAFKERVNNLELELAVKKANLSETKRLQGEGLNQVKELSVQEIELNASVNKSKSEADKAAAEKAKQDRDKAASSRLAAQQKQLADELAVIDLARKKQEKIIIETAATEERANEMRNEADITQINSRILIFKKFGQEIIDEEIKLSQIISDIDNEAFEKQKELQEKLTQQTKDSDAAILDAMKEGVEKEKAQRIAAFEAKIFELEEQGVLTEELEKQLQERLFESLREIDEKEAKERNDRLIKEIEQRKMLIDASIKTFEEGISIISDLITLSNLDASQAAEFQKTLAVFQVGLELAKSLATVISSATTAAAATGPLAPITLAGYIASGIAAITGAFVQVKAIFDQPAPKPAAKGDERVTGGRKGVDSVLYNLMPDERIVRADTNMKYWDELHAMHMGNDYFEKLVNMKYVQPAVQEILSNNNSGGGISSGIMGSLTLNGKWKGQNIVSVLNNSAKQQKKQHREIVEVLKPKRNNLRKF